MLSIKDLSLLNETLKSTSTNITFKSFYENITKTTSKPEYVKLSRGILFVIENELIDDYSIVLYLLYSLFQNLENDKSLLFLQSSLNSFKKKSHLPQTIVFFIDTLLSDKEQIKEISIFKPLDILNMQMQTPCKQNHSELSLISFIVPYVLSDADFLSNQLKTDIYNSDENQPLENFIKLVQSSTLSTGQINLNEIQEPEFIRIPPLVTSPMLSEFSYERKLPPDWKFTDPLPEFKPDMSHLANSFSDDFIWLYPPSFVHEFHFDFSIDANYSFPDVSNLISEYLEGQENDNASNENLDIDNLIKMAFTSGLTQEQQNYIVEIMNKDPLIVKDIDPEDIPKLVNKNPFVAIKVLSILLKTDKLTEYSSALIKMEITVQSMEVVNRLSTQITLPDDFIHIYISNCLKACNTAEDKYMKIRLVRIICVLIQSLIRNKILDINRGSILVEVQSFCLENNDVRASNTLYRLIKNIESNKNSSLNDISDVDE